MFKTYQPKAAEIARAWHLLDAKNKVLGRLATEVAKLLSGKHKATYAAYLDMGDYVVMINAKDIQVTGKKEKQKIYWRHSGYPGGLKQETLEDVRRKHPEKLIEHAVLGMLPKNKLRDGRMRRLKVFAGSDHPYKDKFSAKGGSASG